MADDDKEVLTESLELLSIPGFLASMKRSVTQMESGDTLSAEEVLGDEE